ncbi:MAG: carbohydrate kinase, partial [Thermoleophilia bacterium]|nr:carbohydrate kinase [Thermoleophilia bacterium]
VATLYVALMLDVTLDNLRSHGPVVLDGGLAQNGALLGLVAALREGQTLSATGNSEGTAMGAAALAFEAAGLPVPFRAVLSPVAPRAPAGLAGYRDRWRSEAAVS